MHVILMALGYIYLAILIGLGLLLLSKAAKREQAKHANEEVVGTFTHKRATTVPRFLMLGLFSFLFPKRERVTITRPKAKQDK